MSAEQKKLQSLSDDYQKLQTDLQSNIEARQKLESQQQENLGVQKEFASLDSSANIYKLVGPVLLKQDRSEAVLAVDGRLEFIDKEMYEFSPVSCSTSAPEREFSFCCSRKTEPRRANAIFVSVVGSAECSKRVEKQIQDMQTKSENTKMEVYRLQTQMQQSQG